jgi:two-component system, LytTR family, sensor kinase
MSAGGGPAPVSPPVRRTAIVVGAWTVFGAFFATREFAHHFLAGQPLDWTRIPLWFVTGYLWAALTPAIQYLARRFPFTRTGWKRAVVAHACGSALFAATELLVWLGVCLLLQFHDLSGFWHEYWNVLVLDVHVQIWVYAVTLAVIILVDFYEVAIEREKKAADLQLRASQLQTRLTDAQLEVLRTQLQPHFLFNTLNSIMVLLRKGNCAEAEAMLSGLAGLLRCALDSHGSAEVPLHREIDFIRRYLEIEQIRFRDRLRVEYELAEQALNTSVPTFVLQPVVENAIRHGISRMLNGGSLHIRAAICEQSVVLEVTDSGAGPNAHQSIQTGRGIGLGNLRARLAQLYGTTSSFELSSVAGGGTRARIILPVRLAIR